GRAGGGHGQRNRPARVPVASATRKNPVPADSDVFSMNWQSMRRHAMALTLGLTLARGGAAESPASFGGPLPHSASVPTVAFAPDGTLWAAWVDASHVYA